MSKRLDENIGAAEYDGQLDNDDSGAAGVGAAPNGGEEGSETDDKAKVDAIVGIYNSTKTSKGGKN